MRYEEFRREYTAGGLSRQMLADCPLTQFEIWLKQAVQSGMQDPTAMVLATVADSGMPWQRIVLLKGLSAGGFEFYTNYASDKGCAIANFPEVALLFPWTVLDRQVIVGGSAHKMTVAEATAYFQKRPRESQIAACVSQQSKPLNASVQLEQRAQVIRQQFKNAEIPMPEHWGGYRVIPRRIEFWQGGAHRLHDRFVYQKGLKGGWSIEQLQP